ncbi:MAG TPA: GIY-YIG nuclease family protein [Patescibacteria group bacterium]|nr:GIY-YIG nuclease family protein [Patescibacteria group bacterium]
MLASKANGTIYIGVTNNLPKRITEHKHDFADGFSKKYRVHRLVYYEMYTDIKEAIHREKQLKWWKRDWKIKLIIEKNPGWNDLYKTIF